MPETTEVKFGLEEITALMVRESGQKVGLWRLLVEFGLGVMNVPAPGDETVFSPGVIAGLQKVGIVRCDDSPVPGITIDAATGEPFRGSSGKGERLSRP